MNVSFLVRIFKQVGSVNLFHKLLVNILHFVTNSVIACEFLPPLFMLLKLLTASDSTKMATNKSCLSDDDDIQFIEEQKVTALIGEDVNAKAESIRIVRRALAKAQQKKVCCFLFF